MKVDELGDDGYLIRSALTPAGKVMLGTTGVAGVRVDVRDSGQTGTRPSAPFLSTPGVAERNTASRETSFFPPLRT